MPIGRRRSSAIWPSSPAARASRAKPRSSSTGRPRSASAAPQTPAPLSGSRAAEHLLVDPADRLEQPQVRAAQALLLGDPDQHAACAGPRPCAPGGRDPGRTCPASRVRRTASSASASHPASSVGQVAVVLVEHGVQVAAAVLGHAEEARPAAEQPGGQRALQRVGRGEVGEPGRDRGRGEAVVGQRDQHRLEDPGLATASAGAARPARRPARRSRPCPSGRP